ncbi:MAG: DUF1501 domain-containing protein [Gammaproteobacteria bacterium]|nr:DUF1501 domain-containing protein [Gammaproteobacteria bacterium]
MKRRDFLKAASIAGATRVIIPASLTMHSLLNKAYAAAPNYAAAVLTPPSAAAMPRVINIFLYGGPSDLAANLTNIGDINLNSQTSYANTINGITTTTAADATNGQINSRGFWKDAGGTEMSEMVTDGQMTVYRTLTKRKEDSRSHRQSIFMGLKGSLDIDNTPGMGTRIATLMDLNRGVLNGSAALGGKTVDQLVLPFVSFEGATTAFAPDPSRSLPLTLKGITLSETLDNPFARDLGVDAAYNAELNALIDKVVTAQHRVRYSKAVDSFVLRQQMEGLVDGLRGELAGNIYPANNGYSGRIKAAVTLALSTNADSFFITVGGGLGGWDDHNNGTDRYADRMRQLMQALRFAVNNHIANSASPHKNNIVINVFGEFGRHCNLNASSGWDHGNTQILYTLGAPGSAGAGQVRPVGALGKVVGKTQRVGPSKQNNQDLMPTNDSYEAEPMAIASTVYKYFGVQNPEVLTSNDSPLNESVADEPSLF